MTRDELLNSLSQMFLSYAAELKNSIEAIIPATVVSVGNNQRLSAQPVIPMIQTLPEDAGLAARTNYITRPQLNNIPYIVLKGGGLCLTLPVSPGDEALLLICDKAIARWLETGAIVPPPEIRSHNLTDAVALVGMSSNANVISDISTDSAQLRTNDGSAAISLSKTGDITLNTGGTITLTGANIIINGIEWGTHVHGGVQTGGSTTLAPEEG